MQGLTLSPGSPSSPELPGRPKFPCDTHPTQITTGYGIIALTVGPECPAAPKSPMSPSEPYNDEVGKQQSLRL